MKKIFLIVITAIVFFGCANDPARDNVVREELTLDTIFAQYFEGRLQLFPLEATSMGDRRFDDLLAVNITHSYRDTIRAFFQRYLEKVNDLSYTSLDEDDKVNYDIFKRDIIMSLEGLKYPDHLMPVNQFWGLPLTFAQLGSGKSIHPFETVQDYDNFLKRMAHFKIYSDSAIANMRRGMKENIVMPAVLMEKVKPQYEAMLVQDVTESIFYMPIENMPDSFTAADKQRLEREYTQAIRELVIPAYQNMYNFIDTEYLPVARPEAGISAIPGGEAYYRYLVKYWTTTDLTPEEIYRTGKKEVARIRQEMEAVKKQVGFEGTLQEFFVYVNNDLRFFPFRTEEEVLDHFRDMEAKMQPFLKEMFGKFPITPFEIRQTEKFREASASAEYQPGTPDGSRPGIFYTPIPDPRKFNYHQMESLFLHEAIPGHHYQISLQQENEDLPKFRQFSWYGAYGEGWALYAESLGKELGLYTDPYQYLGKLSAEMHRAVRLVVDVGMHAKGWSRERAIKYSLANEPVSEEETIAEIERYMAIPGQALSYKIGELKIRELRNRAEEALGERFDLAAFHDEVLSDGVLPLDVLEKKIERWIEEQKRT